MLTDERLKDLSRCPLSASHLETAKMALEILSLRAALSSIAEVIPEYASEAWMVQEARDALGVKDAE